jgi:copper chaperone CopZ
MIHTYDVEQLKNQADAELITERLKSVDGVRTIAVSLEKYTVTIDMDHHIAQDTFNSVLAGSGPWKLVNERMVRTQDSRSSLVMRYLPAIIVTCVLIVVALLLVIR